MVDRAGQLLGWFQLQLADSIYATLCGEHMMTCHENVQPGGRCEHCQEDPCRGTACDGGESAGRIDIETSAERIGVEHVPGLGETHMFYPPRYHTDVDLAIVNKAAQDLFDRSGTAHTISPSYSKFFNRNVEVGWRVTPARRQPFCFV
jgi:hypothetical protein